jgi:hypothetical protein
MGVAFLGFAFWREAGLLYTVLAGMACGWTFGLTFAAHYIERMERSSSRLPSEQCGGK